MNENNVVEKRNAPGHPSMLILVGLLIGALLVFHFFGKFADWFIPPNTSDQPTTSSDKIAAASALFSALAFVGLLYTILLQRHELLAQSREQDLLRDQVDRQAFEGTFFHLLRLHIDNVRTQTAQVVPRGELYIGRRAFGAAALELEGRIANQIREHPDEPLSLETINEIYSGVCETSDSDFGHYFRNLYHIVKYVHTAEVSDYTRYIGQVRAQLSQAEFVLLLANGLRRGGKSKFKPLMEGYALLHEMRVPEHLHSVARFYAASAFGNREVTV